jgi:predicted negative regulator of RcsB-dependent stress response
VSEYRTDEETVELIQGWWRENGVSMVVTLLLVFGGVFGWRAWQEEQAGQVAAASARYLDWLDARGVTEESALAVAESLREDFPESPYVALVALEAARSAVEDGDEAAARRELISVLETELPAAFHDLARLRLARLDLASGDAAAALAQLDGIQGADDLATILEVRGDAHRLGGDLDAARAAYDAAIEAAEQSGGSSRPLLEMKRDDLTVAAAAPEVTQ